MSELSLLLMQADRARRLAGMVSDPELVRRLTDYARECESRVPERRRRRGSGDAVQPPAP